jgi:hypothetical protein
MYTYGIAENFEGSNFHGSWDKLHVLLAKITETAKTMKTALLRKLEPAKNFPLYSIYGKFMVHVMVC